MQRSDPALVQQAASLPDSRSDLEWTGASEIAIAGATAPFEAKARDGRVRPADGAPEAIAAALKAVPNSTRWKRLAVNGGPEGIVVTRKGGGQSDWLCDLWLAERLASA